MRGEDPDRVAAGERRDEVAHAALELADVGHPGVDLGRAGLEGHPALAGERARGGAHAARGARCRARRRRSAACRRGSPPPARRSRRRAARRSSRSGRARSPPAGAARGRSRAARRACAGWRPCARSWAPTEAGIASPSSAREVERVVELGVGDVADVDALVAAPRDRLRSSSAALCQPLGPALAKIAVISPSPMWVSSARSRKTVRCPRDDRDQRLQRRQQVDVLRPPRQRLERDRAGDRVLAPAFASSATSSCAAISSTARWKRSFSRSAAARRSPRGSARRDSSALPRSSAGHRSPASSS